VDVADLSALGGAYRGGLKAVAGFQGTPAQGRLTVEGTGTNLGIGNAEVDRLLAGQTALSALLAVQDGVARLEKGSLRNSQVEASASGTAAALDLKARIADLGLLLPEFPGAVTVAGTAKAKGGDYEVALTGTGPGQIAARVSGLVAANGARADLTLAGSAQAGLANAFLRPRTISGPVRFDLRLKGPIALQSLSGRVALAGGRLSDPDLPFSLTDITAQAELAAGQARVGFSTGLTSGGNITGKGTVALTAPYDARITADLSQVVAKDPRLYQTRMNGSVALDGPVTGGAVISGRITLNETELRIPSTGLGVAGQLPGLEHVNEPGDVRLTRARAGLIAEGGDGGGAAVARPFGLDLVLSAPERVFVRGRGLDAELGGELRLGGTTADIVPSGAFELIRGRLDILGKRLVLSEARLQLEGTFDPLIEVLASAESDGITSSVRISGRASAPEVSFVSVPELPQEEVLAHLLFGRGLTQLSAFQAVQLAGAVATLAGRGGEGIVSKLRKGFGLDDLDVQTSDEGGTSVKAGKYLSQNLYTEVIVGDDGQSEIQLNLDVTDSVTVRGRVKGDGATGLGVFFEKDY
jgi:translocation and assembly module TamB